MPDIYISPNGFFFLSTADLLYQGRLLDPFELCRAMLTLRVEEKERQRKCES